MRVVLCVLVGLCAGSSLHAQSPDAGIPGVQVHGLLQGWVTASSGESAPAVRLRRAEVQLGGRVTPAATWTVMVDAARAIDNLSILQDAFVTVKLHDRVGLRVGRLVVPLSLEGTRPAGELELLERSLLMTDGGRHGRYGDVRDVGALLDVRSGPLLYQVGYFRGESLFVEGGRRAVVGRVQLAVPAATWLRIGGSAASDAGGGDRSRHANRMGGDLAIALSRWTFMSEIMKGTDDGIDRLGHATLAEYRLTSSVRLAGRVEMWDPDTTREWARSDTRERAVTGGATWQVPGRPVRLQANYVRRWARLDTRPSHEVRTGLQTSW